MNNKGKVWIWITIGFVVLIIIILTILIISNQNNSKEELEAKNRLDVYLSAKDSKYQTSLDGKYILLNNSFYLQGDIIKDTLTQIKSIQNNYTEILCKSEGFYSKKIEYNFTEKERLQNSSKINCYLDKIGTLQIDSTGQLTDGESHIDLYILAKDYYKNIKICTSWSSGIINVESNYNKTKIPMRYNGLIDKCWNINTSLKDNSIIIPFKIKSEGLNKLDEVVFIILDEEITFDGTLNNYYSEFNSINLGKTEDDYYVLKWGGEYE